MFPHKPVIFQVLHILFPTVSIIGNGFVVYVTVRSRALRNPCGILIAMVSLSDMMLLSSHLIGTAYHNLMHVAWLNPNVSSLHHSVVFVPPGICCPERCNPFEDMRIPQYSATLCSVLFPDAVTQSGSGQIAVIDGVLINAMKNIAYDQHFITQFLFSRILICSHSKLYLCAQILPACVLGIAMDTAVFIYQRRDEEVICIMASTIKGKIVEIYIRWAMLACALTILCYGCFILILRRIRMSGGAVKSIYRSVIIISLSFIFGYFSSIAIIFVNTVLDLNIDVVYLNQSAAIFVALATCANFFIYYCISMEYRKLFDKYLGIGRFKMVLTRKDDRTGVQHIAPIALRLTSKNAPSGKN